MLTIEQFKKQENKRVDFKEEIKFAESGEKGSFEGILVKYENKKLAHGIFRFAKDSLKKNNRKKLFILYQHMGSQVPVGTMEGKSDSEGFKVVAQLDLSLLENGNPINPAAHALYSLMKDMGAKFDLSVGGYITRKEVVTEDDSQRYVLIKEFDAYEGSIVMRGAVEGSKVTNVFSEEENNNMEEKRMDLTLEQIQAAFAAETKKFKKEMFTANTEEEINGLKEKFEEMSTKFNDLPESMSKAELEDKFSEINEVMKTLGKNYSQENAKEFTEIEEMYSVFSQVQTKGKEVYLTADGEIKLSEEIKANFAASTGSVPDAIKPTYVMKILERLQAANPLLAEVDFLSITDNSLKISREELGLPTTGIVGETDARVETTTVTLDNVTVELYQWYVLPVVSNKLLATNYVGYLPFLLKRAEYAMALNMANKLLNGSGTNEPLGILNNTDITNIVTLDIKTGGADLDDGEFAKKIKDIYYSVRSEIAEKSKWSMRRATWNYITNLQNADKTFYIGDLQRTGERTLMNRPVILVEDDNSGLIDIDPANGSSTVDDTPIMLFGDIREGVQGIVNNKMTISLEDKVTSKGFTKYWMEKGAGMEVKLPENFVIVKQDSLA